jgi:hypothetical protein
VERCGAQFLPKDIAKLRQKNPATAADGTPIYPIPESDFVIEPFELSDWWPRAYATEGRLQSW